MNSIKSFFMLLVLVGVGYGVYRTLHLKNPQQVPPGVDTSIPAIDLQLASSTPGSMDPGGSAPKFSGSSSPAPTTLAPREPRRDNIVNAPLGLSTSPAPTTSIGFGEPLQPTPRGNDFKLEAPPASDNPGSAMLPPLNVPPKSEQRSRATREFTDAAIDVGGLNAPTNSTPANPPLGGTPLAGFSAPAG